MDLYDKQTMKNGGITAPGRFKNPEGNWVSKYANGGDISIPDLSRPNWLDKYQDGRQFNKYDIMSGVYDDMKQSAVPSSTYVDMPAPTKQDVQRVQTEAKRVNQKMKDTGVKSPAEVYAKEAVESKLMQQPTLNPAEEKSVGDYIGHGWDIATHPTTALGYKVRGQEIPWGFSKADYNPFEVATAVINPATYINAAGRLASAAVSPSTYTNMLPKTLGALAGTMMNENVPEEWTNEAIKSGMLALDASTLPILRSVGRTAPAKEAAKYLTTQTPLKNAYKLNPQAKGSLFKPWDDNMGYRVVNQEGYDDALKSFLVRSNPKGDNTVFSRPTGFPSFAKGKPSKNFLNTDATPHYIMETDMPLYARGDVNPVTGIPIRSSHGAARPIDPITGEALTSLPIEDINAIYKAQPNWLKGYERVYNSPKNFNFKNFKQGKNIAESGAFNQGVYELPDYPGYLLKYERPEQVADYIPEFKGMNMAEMQKGLTSPNIGKVIKQHTISNPNQKDLNAYIMRRMEGQPLTSLDIDQVTNIPREAWIQYAKDYNEIARNNLAIDNMGSNVFYDRASKSFKFIDLSPGVTPKMDQYWANTVIGDISPRLSEEKLKEAIRNGILGQIEKNTQYNVEKANKVLRDKADDMNLTLDDMLNLSNDFDLQGSLTKSAVKRSLMREGFKNGGWLNRYQDGSQVPQSWKDKYDWTPNVEEEYLQFKNDPNAPENLKFTDDMKDYNTRGMWDSLDRPSNWQQALDLHKQQQGYEWTPEDDGYYHAWSQHPGTGEWLKPRHHSTGWMNYMGYAFDPENTVVVNPEGFFGNDTLQAYPRQKKKDGGPTPAEGYYDYINGYSGIFAKGGVSSKQSSWLNKYK
jgi:hypothetical protein